MAYDKNKILSIAIRAIEREDLLFIEDVVKFLPVSKSTFYEHFPNGSQGSNLIKDALFSIKIKNEAKPHQFISQIKEEPESELEKKIRKRVEAELSCKFDYLHEQEKELSTKISNFERIKKTQKNYAIRLKLIELENQINKKPRSSKRSDSVIDVDFEEQSNLLAEVNKIRKMINQL